MYSPAHVGLFDLDGSLADYEASMLEQMKLLRAPCEPEGFDVWSEEPFMEARRDLIARVPGFWKNLQPIERGFQILTVAQNIGFKVEILTKGPRTKSRAWMEKLDWCNQYLPIDIDIHITLNKARTYGKFLYDDYPDYMTAWLDSHKRGLGIMPLLPRNADYKHPRCIHFDGTNVSEITDVLKICYNRKFGEELML
jgi:hypothetical protein